MARLGDVSVRFDTKEFERMLRVLRRRENGDPDAGRTESSFLRGRDFVRALEEGGLLPRGTTYVRITAEVDGVVTLDYETIAEEDLVAVAAGFTTTNDPTQAVPH